MNTDKATVDAGLESLQCETFSYFLHGTNPKNDLVLDMTAPDRPASIAATELALASYPVAIECGFIARAAAIETALATLQFFWHSRQVCESDATGHRGLYCHFLDMQTGQRAWRCELSTVDSTILLAGVLTAGAYFYANTTEKKEIRTLADALYRRANWRWAQKRRCNGHARMETRKRIFDMAVERLRRDACAVYPGIRLAHAPATGRALRGVGFHL